MLLSQTQLFFSQLMCPFFGKKLWRPEVNYICAGHLPGHVNLPSPLELSSSRKETRKARSLY